MSDIKQKALDFLKSNAEIKEVFATSDGFLFTKKSDATDHAKVLDADNPKVESFTNNGKKTTDEKLENKKPKLSVAEYKELKEKATVEYKELFGTEPDANLSGVKIQELNDAKKAEVTNAKN